MGMPETAHRWTAEMVRALPDDGNRYEVIDGELFVTPAPRALHQRAVLELAIRLRGYADAGRVGETLISPADIVFREDRLVQPDVFVAPLRPDGGRIREWSEIHGLLLAVEVLSPSTARADRQVKRRLYQEEPVGEYWIVDLDARVIERWRRGDQRPEVLSERLIWQPAAAAAPLEVDLPAFFRSVLDD
jgi:Uma2 family endonuclease